MVFEKFLPIIDPLAPPKYSSLISLPKGSLSLDEPPEKTTSLFPLKHD